MISMTQQSSRQPTGPTVLPDMLFPSVSPSREECVAAIAQALQADKGRIYLDANVLIHCYEMSALASGDLLGTLERYGERVGVPVWAARETWEYVTKRVNRKPLQALSGRIRRDFADFRRETARYLDDNALSGQTKDEYQRDLVVALDKVEALITRVAQHEPKIDQTTGRLLPFIEERRLPSDLPAVLDEVSRTVATRVAHRIPPGFADASQPRAEEADGQSPFALKGRGKAINPNGDLIIWLEVLADCVRNRAEHLVVLTKDTHKEDWVYNPQKVRDDRGRPQLNNGGVTLPLPLLVYEAQRACPTLRSVHIVSVEMVAQIWVQQRFDVVNLAAALQSEEEPTDRKADPTDGSAAAVSTIEVGYVVEFGSADMVFESRMDDENDMLISDLAREDWRVQNQAVRRLEPQLAALSRTQRVQVGRGLVAAANLGAVEPAEFLRRVLSNEEVGRPARSDVLIGALAETYIAETGDPKKPMAKRDVVLPLYMYEGHSELAEAYDAVLRRLRALRREYLALPHEPVIEIRLEITLQKDALVNAMVGEAALFEQDAPSSRALQRSGRDVIISVGELIELIAEEFVVPANRLTTDLPSATNITVPAHVGFVVWGPKTGTYLR